MEDQNLNSVDDDADDGTEDPDHFVTTEMEESNHSEYLKSLKFFPTIVDLYEKPSFPNAIEKERIYDSVENYLVTKFHSLQNKMFQQSYFNYLLYLHEFDHKKMTNFIENVRLIGYEYDSNDVGIKVQTELIDQLILKKMEGKVLLLINHDLKSLLFAILVDPIVREDSNKKLFFLIKPVDDSIITLDMTNLYAMVALNINFDFYWNTLNALKNFNAINFPMKNYWLKNENCHSCLPSYLKNKPDLFYNDKFLPINLEKNLPDDLVNLQLDESQLKALKFALTHEFTAIQGPIRTGKTYLITKIIQILLQNQELWSEMGPIVIVSSKKNILDLMMDQIFNSSESLFCIEDNHEEVTKPYSLKYQLEQFSKKENYLNSLIKNKTIEITDVIKDIEHCNLKIKNLVNKDILVSLNILFENEASMWESNTDLWEWLIGKSIISYINFSNQTTETDESNEDDNSNHEVFSLKIYDDYVARIEKEIQLNGHEKPYLQKSLEIIIQEKLYLQRELARHPLSHNESTPSDNPRWNIYWDWLKSSYEQTVSQKLKLVEVYRQHQMEIDQLIKKANLQVFKEKNLIGLTPTTAINYQTYIQALRVPIMLVDDADKITETDILCLLTNECKHLILSGNSLNSSSLFKRIDQIKNECLVQLNYQYSMRPEIADLYSSIIPQKIINHDSVSNFRNIEGMEKNLFFIDHENSEDEAIKFLVEFVQYLLCQGYKPKDINIVFFLNSQLMTFNSKIENNELFKQLNLSTIQQLNQETFKICILFSLFDSEKNNEVILKKENLLLILSSAREGLYIMGNMKSLIANNIIWKTINVELIEKKAIGKSINLKCRLHLDQIFEVKSFEDFKGCGKICGKKRLNCNHKCGRLCHALHKEHILSRDTQKCINCLDDEKCPLNCEYEKCTSTCEIRLPCGHSHDEMCHEPLDHSEVICPKKCSKTNLNCVNNHPCKKLCHEKCETCSVIIDKKLSCGHIYNNVQCSQNVNELICSDRKITKCPSGHDQLVQCNSQENTPTTCNKKCTKLLICGHECVEKCKDPCTKLCQVMVEMVEFGPCNHLFSIPCFMQSGSPMELTEYCVQPCNTVLACSHLCSGNCYICFQGRVHMPCEEPCHTIFICGHSCEIPCDKECEPCSKKCEFHCQHSKCDKRCGEPCQLCQEDCDFGCEHRQCSKRCFEVCDIDPCNEPCKKILPCDHFCSGFCGDPCPTLCRICHQKELEEIIFGHEDESQARYVLLKDCGHTVESKALLRWINSCLENPEITMINCPLCKTQIMSKFRFTPLLKKNFMDINEIKKKIFFNDSENQDLKINICESLETLKKEPVVSNYEMIQNYLANNVFFKKNLCIQESRALIIIIDKLKEMFEILKSIDWDHYDYNHYNHYIIEKQINVLLKAFPKKLHISEQAIEDIQLELRRFFFIVELYKLDPEKNCDEQFDENESNDIISKELLGVTRFSNKDTEEKIKNLIGNVKELKERQTIVKAIGMEKGHWFKCPSGHYYVIGECGEAMQRRKCIECEAIIGGEDHRVETGNTLATEIDGAEEPAWPTALM